MRAVIICAGEGTRWNNFLDVPKHLIEIDGEKLLHRTVRLLKEKGVSDIHIVVKEKSPEYEVSGATQYVARNTTGTDADKFLSSKELWNKDGKTIVLYGDCFFTNEAMETIIHNQENSWLLFCCPHASSINGKTWGECFAQTFYPHNISEHEAMLEYVAYLKNTGVISRCGGWEHYRAMNGMTGKKVRHPHKMYARYVVIDDMTTDFDYPEDYKTWLSIWKKIQK